MDRDPHDALLLTERPTTVVTQHTAMNDCFPTPYGSQGEEAGIFGSIGDDNGIARNAAAQAGADARTMANVPGVATGGDASAVAVVPAGAVGGGFLGLSMKTWVGVGVGLALLSAFGVFKRR